MTATPCPLFRDFAASLTFYRALFLALAQQLESEREDLKHQLEDLAQSKDDLAAEMKSQLVAGVGVRDILQVTMHSCSWQRFRFLRDIENSDPVLRQAKVEGYENELEEARQAQKRWSADRDALEANLTAKTAHTDKLAMQVRFGSCTFLPIAS